MRNFNMAGRLYTFQSNWILRHSFFIPIEQPSFIDTFTIRHIHTCSTQLLQPIDASRTQHTHNLDKMSMSFLKTEKFLRLYPIVLFYQHNNLSVDQWAKVRIQLKSMKDTKIFLIKNTIVNIFFQQAQILNQEVCAHMFQGPCFAVGILEYAQLKDILSLLSKTQKIILIGGVFNGKIVNHLDIEKYIQLDNTIYPTFVSLVRQDHTLYNFLQQLKRIDSVMSSVFHKFIYCLELLKVQSKKMFLFMCK